MPWEEDPDSLDDPPPFILNSEGEHHDLVQSPELLSSSIHAIYRPIARSRRNTAAIATNPAVAASSYFTHALTAVASQSDAEDTESSISDFEQSREIQLPATTPAIPTDTQHISSPTRPPGPRAAMTRSGSLATVRRVRRSRLAEKLRDIFELEGVEEVIAGM